MKAAEIAGVVEPVRKWDPRKDGTGSFTYVDLSSVDHRLKEVTEPAVVDTDAAPSRARQLIRSGDVLVSTVRPNLNAVAYVQPQLDGATASTGFSVLRPREGKLDGRYLFHWVRTETFIGRMVQQATGASYPAISDRIVQDSAIPLPPVEQQRRIAGVLDTADALRAKRRQAITKLDTLTQAIFIEMFGNPLSNPSGWPQMKLGELAEKFSDGPFGSNLKSEHYVEDGVRVIRLQNIGVGALVDEDRAFVSESHFAQLRKHECLPGDVLVGTLGDPNLRACIQPAWLRTAINKADCVQIRVDHSVATPEWMCALLNSPFTEAKARTLVNGQTRDRISMGRLRQLEVPVPPIRDQARFAASIHVAELCAASLVKSLEQLDQLFVSLQQRAFRGEL